jgi:hypothetical protein
MEEGRRRDKSRPTDYALACRLLCDRTKNAAAMAWYRHVKNPGNQVMQVSEAELDAVSAWCRHDLGWGDHHAVGSPLVVAVHNDDGPAPLGTVYAYGPADVPRDEVAGWFDQARDDGLLPPRVRLGLVPQATVVRHHALPACLDVHALASADDVRWLALVHTYMRGDGPAHDDARALLDRVEGIICDSYPAQLQPAGMAAAWTTSVRMRSTGIYRARYGATLPTPADFHAARRLHVLAHLAMDVEDAYLRDLERVVAAVTPVRGA